MLKARFKKYQLKFKRPAGTSRGVYTTRDTWFLLLWHTEKPEQIAIGECAPLPNLSCDAGPDYESVLQELCSDISNYQYWLDERLLRFPSIRFGLETALLDLENGTSRVLFDTPFSRGKDGILMNGLIWMGEVDFMRQQIDEKIAQGFHCIKLKIGAIDFEEELAILKMIRASYSPEVLELRVDANGAFAANKALSFIKALVPLHIHSIEQPISQGQPKEMAHLCEKSPVPIALDEELIGGHTYEEKMALLTAIKPQFIVLKPSLHGGIAGCDEWIKVAENLNIGWWITSALESNIGLNAIAQWTATLNSEMPQGLGTGQLFTNNFESPLRVNGERLYHRSKLFWYLSSLLNG